MAKILVIDLGTSYFKFALFDRGGQLCGLAQREPPLQRPVAGRLELAAGDFVRTIADGIAEGGCQAGGLSDVEAISFATQTNSFLLLDDRQRPLTPIILWPDRRAENLGAAIQARFGLPGLTATSGISALNFQFVLAKLLWLRCHEPAIWPRIGRLCLISDYLTQLLTGRHITEAGTAGLTAMADIHRCQWRDEILAQLELDRDWLPEIVRAGTDLGPITRAAAAEFGLPATCRFVVGCLDQYAGAIGAGNVEPNMISETTGTVLATVRLAEKFAPDLPLAVFQGPAFVEGQYWRMAFGEVSANYLQWYRELLPDRPGFEILTGLAATVAPGADGLTLATDSPPSTPEAVFRGWTARHTRGHAVRAILEAVARALSEQVASVSGGTLPAEIRSAGGAARSALWLQIKADVLGVPVRATHCPEPTSLGGAVLAESALGSASVPAIAAEWVRLGQVYRPDRERQQLYEELRWKR
ncbi:MAG: FGGY-family carbohydrate kinase [Thermoguttaceae bacterium]